MQRIKFPTKAVALKIMTTAGVCFYPDQPPDFADHSLGMQLIEAELYKRGVSLNETEFAVLCNDVLQETVKLIILKERGELNEETLKELKYYPLQSLSEDDIHSVAIFGVLSKDLTEKEKEILNKYNDVLKLIRENLKDKKI